MRILLVEDDPIIGDGVTNGLTRQGFSVDWFTDGILGHDAASAAQYDAVVLDLTLPGADGLAILARWRAHGIAVPVLILTARGALDQRVEGLNSGADDYLAKPFALEELTARLRALIRRNKGQSGALLTHGSIVLNPATRSISRDGEPVTLSPKAFALVELFLLNNATVLSRSAIEEKLYPWGEEISSNAVEVHVHSIRRALGKDFIRTVHGVGYVLGNAP